MSFASDYDFYFSSAKFIQLGLKLVSHFGTQHSRLNQCYITLLNLPIILYILMYTPHFNFIYMTQP